MRVHDFIECRLEKVAASREAKIEQDASAYFKFQSMTDAINSRDALHKVLKKRKNSAKKGGIGSFFARRSISPLQRDIQSFDNMIAYGKQHGIK